MQISFCTSVRNRLSDIQQTLPANLLLLREDEELVVLDYASPDGLRDWVLKTFPKQLQSGQLRLYSEPAAPRFVMSHAKNVSGLLGQGLILVNVDADNFLTDDYLKTVREFPAGMGMIYPRWGSGGFKGRVAIRRDIFRKMGGHDERMNAGYGYEEIDLYERTRRLHPVSYVKIDPASCIPTSLEKKAEAQAGSLTMHQSGDIHVALSRQAIRAKQLVANKGKLWGVADLIDHTGTVLRTGWRS